MNTKLIKSEEETKQLAIEIAKEATAGKVITLTGTLGAGKTFFTSCLINELTEKPTDVQSPTFSIMKEYQGKNFPIYHFDLYRVKKAEELYELDIENCFENGLCIIEWPEIAEDLIYNRWLDIEIEILEGNSRKFKLDN